MKCHKISYESKTDALKSIKAIYIQRRISPEKTSKDGRKLRTYQCPMCGKWHLTTRGRRKYD